MTNSISTAIIGANGYSGRELARLLLAHPHATLKATLGRKPNWQLSDDLPEACAKLVKHYSLDDLQSIATEVDTIFLATPPEISLEVLPKLVGTAKHIIDLSGALRIPAHHYETWYKQQHPHPTLIQKASYGLSPWWAQRIHPQTCQIIANPGCYATCALMALLPLLKAQIIQAQGIIIDAKSGLSGAGRHAQENLLFCETAYDCYPYKIGAHQHTPEIEYYLQKFGLTDTADQSLNLLLNTHVLPLKRGITMSIYPRLTVNCDDLDVYDLQVKILQAFDNAYQNYMLARYTDLSQICVEKHSKTLSLTQVVGSARTHIAWHIVNRQLVLFASIDNLLKGAASQAIENFNWLHDLPYFTSLNTLEGLL